MWNDLDHETRLYVHTGALFDHKVVLYTNIVDMSSKTKVVDNYFSRTTSISPSVF